MAEGTINNGDYEQTDDANGDWVIKDPQGNIVQKWDDTNNVWDFNQQDITNINSVVPDDLANTTRYISTSDSLTTINTKLSSSGVVVFESGTHEVSDRIDITSNDISVIIPPDATVKYATGASVTAVTLNTNDNRPVFVADGHSNVTLKNHGTINALTSDTTNNRQGVLFHDCTDSVIDGEGGNVIDCLVAYRVIDGNDTDVMNAESDDSLESVVELQGTVGCTVQNTFADARNVNMKEAVDVAAHNSDFVVDGVVAIDGGSAINAVEVYESGDGTVRNVHCDNVGIGVGFRAEVPSSTTIFTDKTARGNADNVTINGVKGTADNLIYAVEHGTSNTAVNPSFLNIEGVADGYAIRIQSKAAGQLDGLTVTGKVRSENSNSNPATRIDGIDGQITDVALDLQTEAGSSASHAITIASADEVTGVVRVDAPSGNGVNIFAHDNRTCFNHNLQIVSVGAGDHGLRVDGFNEASGDGTVEDCVFTGTATDSTNADVDFSAAVSNCKYVGIAPTTSDAGTGNTFV